jgi:hypothetical protein
MHIAQCTCLYDEGNCTKYLMNEVLLDWTHITDIPPAWKRKFRY